MRVLYKKGPGKTDVAEGILISISPEGSYVQTKEGDEIWIPNDNILHLYQNKQEKKEAQVPSWAITVPHPSQIDWEELRKDLSRKQPLIIIQVNDEWHVLIHGSVIEKANILGYEFMTELYKMRPYEIYQATDVSPQKVVEWVKKVRKASWGKHKKPTTIKVSYPKC